VLDSAGHPVTASAVIIAAKVISPNVRAMAAGGITGITRDGGYAEYVIARCEALALVPEDVDPAEVAPLMCAGTF
jgi:D-arabinose 1-dehydrogenase-like Zn-dependent alcohol dehydrogenase